MCVEGDKTSIESGEINPSQVNGEASANDPATSVASRFTRNLGIVFPNFVAALSINRVRYVPRTGEIHDAIND